MPPLTEECVPLPIELETYRALVDEFGGDLAPSAAGGGLCADAEEAEAAAEAAEAAEEAAEAEEDAAEAAEAAEEEVAAEAAEEGEGGDALHEGGVKTTAERVGLLKAIELRSADSWLHRRLCAMRYAAAAAATSPAAPARKLVVFAHHVRVMDCIPYISPIFPLHLPYIPTISALGARDGLSRGYGARGSRPVLPLRACRRQLRRSRQDGAPRPVPRRPRDAGRSLQHPRVRARHRWHAARRRRGQG